MDIMTLGLLTVLILGFYFYGAYVVYIWVVSADAPKSQRMWLSIFWFPALMGIIFMLLVAGLIAGIAIPIIGATLIVDYVYKRFTGKHLIFDGDDYNIK